MGRGALCRSLHPGSWASCCSSRRPSSTPRRKVAVARVERDRKVKRRARRFVGLVQASGVGYRKSPASPSTAFTRWMRKAASCGVQVLETVATGLQQDAASVGSAPTTGWSNGQTGGHVNKLKLLKLQLYERVQFDLRRRRLLLASCIHTKCGITPLSRQDQPALLRPRGWRRGRGRKSWTPGLWRVGDQHWQSRAKPGRRRPGLQTHAKFAIFPLRGCQRLGYRLARPVRTLVWHAVLPKKPTSTRSPNG